MNSPKLFSSPNKMVDHERLYPYNINVMEDYSVTLASLEHRISDPQKSN
jgi:hypothetical protein